jgi:hypothetical protein
MIWTFESNTWMQGEMKLILDSDGSSVYTVICGSTSPTFSVYEEVIEEPIPEPIVPMIDPGTILDEQVIVLGDTPDELISGDEPTGTGTITYQWEEKT